MRQRTLACLWVLVACGTIVAAEGLKQDDRDVLGNAAEVLDTITSTPDKGIPRELLERAECVLVFPNVTKGAFIVGGRYGRGVAVCRDERDEFSAPAFYSMGGGSVGWQWGGEQTDFVLLVMNDDGVEDLLIESRFTLGGQASAAIGPVGRTAEAATDAQLQAQILSWSRAQGVFLGASLGGAVVQPSENANRRLYGREIGPRQILIEGEGVPAPARTFVETANRVAPRPAEEARVR